jgi:hypothetical protein
MNKHRHSRCHYKRNFGSTSTGTNNPPRLEGLRSNRRPTDGSLTPEEQQRQRPPSRAARQLQQRLPGGRCGRKALSHEGREPAIQVGGRRSGGAGGVGNLVGRETFSGCHHLNTAPAGARRPKAHRQVLAPALAGATPEHERRPRGAQRAGRPSGAAVGARKTWTWSARTRCDRRPDGGWNAAPWLGSSSPPSPAWLKEASVGLEDALLPPNVGGRKGLPTHVEATPHSAHSPPQQG